MTLFKYSNDAWRDPFMDFDHFLDRVFRSNSRFPMGSNRLFGNEHSMSVHADIFADDDGYKVIAELPGIPKKAINISLDNSVLTISGEHKVGKGDQAHSYKFSRWINVGSDVDVQKVAATLKDGMLAIVLPKREERKSKTISITG